MRAFAENLSRNRALAHDLVQDALVKAWSKIGSFEQGTNMRAGLFTIVRNTYCSHHRKTRRKVENTDGAMSDGLAQKPDHDGRFQMRDFNSAFDQLTDDQRVAMMLVGAGGFSYEEAAETYGVAVDPFRSRVNRARQTLSELIKLDEDDALEATDAVTKGIVANNQSAA